MAGNYCVSAAGQVKARLGGANIFEVLLPAPVSTPPTGTITIDGTSSPLTFTGQEALSISALSDGRRRLQLASAPTTKLAGKHGAAWVVTDSVCWPCQVASFAADGSQHYAILAEPLAAELPTGETARLFFAYHTAELPVVSEAKPVRDCLLVVDYADRSLTYLVDYVHQVFCTGVTEQDLRRYYYTLSSSPAADAGFSPALQAGEDDLIGELRLQLADRGLTEDDIPASGMLRQAHLLYSAAHMFRLSDAETYRSLAEQAQANVQACLRRLWVDENGDGKPSGQEKQVVERTHGADLRFGVRVKHGRH